MKIEHVAMYFLSFADGTRLCGNQRSQNHRGWVHESCILDLENNQIEITV